ncbi:hypothetical protein WME90_47415 [Sorangium sp. So ce375]|uniref:hypothetical protein n=1 Tax=Sorangium sp. So ce375 TaxID=3133306 RepID=UPI003F5B831D
MTRMKLLGLLMAGLALVACGDDEGSGPGGETGNGSELDGKQLGQLTAAESEQVCADIARSTKVSKEDACELTGIGLSVLGGDCEAVKAECVSSPDEPEEVLSCDTSKFAGCTATVAEAKACTTASAESMKALTCASGLEDLLQQPAACAAINEKCPALFEEEATDGEAP